MVVCSRIQDYSALSKHLNFQSAIYLRSLTPKQTRYYLNSLKADLTGLKALIAGDVALQELAKSPLMLNIMVLAYEGVAVEDLPKIGVVEERRKQLFDAYIERMFRRPTRLKSEQGYSEAQSIRWLTWLAQRMVQQSQTVFFIEGLQPTWLQTEGKIILYRLGNFLITGLIFGLSVGLIGGLSIGLIMAWGKVEIKTVETLKWSWKEVKNNLISSVFFGLIVGLIVGQRLSFRFVEGSNGLSNVLIFWLIIGLIGGLSLALSFVLVSGMKGSAIVTKTIPNQGIYRTARNAGIIGLIIGLIFGLITQLSFGWIFGLSVGPIFEWLYEMEGVYGLITWLSVGLSFGLLFGLFAMVLGGGKACIQHLILRLILYCNSYIPWNYARFLNYASDRIFLQKVGGGYIFIHRLLLEHFAQIKLKS
jgi:hypothetical protein